MKHLINISKYLVIAALLNSQSVSASLDIEVTGAGEHQIPISVVQFAGEDQLLQSISPIIAADLQRSGLFRLVDPKNKSPHELKDVDYSSWTEIDTLVIGNVVIKTNGHITVKFQLLDTVLQTKLIESVVTGSNSEIRALAHRIADLIFEKVTGDAGVFDTRICFISRQADNYQLKVTDSDGYNEKTVFSSNSIIMSPAWSPDGSHLAFAAFENDEAVIYVQSMLTNQRIVVAHFPEINTAPVWAPDGQRLAFVISNDGNSHIFLMRLDGTELQQVTFDDEIDSEPNFSPDGQSLIFESDRSGKVQIYKVVVALIALLSAPTCRTSGATSLFHSL
jgi:TolB protein